MSLAWPSFWNHIRTDDRAAISDILTELLAHGAILGDAGRDRELYLLAREYQNDLADYLAPLHLELVADPDRPLFQLRPVPGDCGLVERFNKAETLVVLTLWRMYHDERMEAPVPTVIVSANALWQRLRLTFEGVDLPKEAQMREILTRLRHRRLVRLQWHEDPERFGDSQIEILPTLPRVIPFEDASAWEQQVGQYQQATDPAEVQP
jgi:hypothetical protein